MPSATHVPKRPSPAVVRAAITIIRRVSTMIFVPAQSSPNSSIEMVTIDPLDLQAAQDRDAAMDPVSERNPTD
jgi:hypothetical protein